MTLPAEAAAAGALPPGEAAERRARAVALRLFLLFLVLYAGLTRGHFQSTDEVSVFETTRSLWERGDLAIPPILDSVEGPDGRRYPPFGVGQSILALPLYGLGKAVRVALVAAGAEDVARALAGPRIAARETRWGGEVEIFVVGLLHAFTGAALVALFFRFSVQLGAGVGASAAAALLLGVTSYVVPFATTFFQHGAEMLGLLLAFLLLHRDRGEPAARRRFAAGLAAAAVLLVRFPAAIGLPALGGYLAWVAWQRRPRDGGIGRTLVAMARDVAPFAAPVLAAVIVHGAVNVVKVGHFSLAGAYATYGLGFRTPALHGLRGLLLSPGKSVFLFTPLLALLPLTASGFARRHRAEAACVLAVAASYLLLYARYDLWHGAWCFGPRFVAAITPFLLLPLASWLERAGQKGRLAVTALAAFGLWMQVLAVAVNFSYVHHHERWMERDPGYGFLFVAADSPPAAHARALLAGDHRVDFWLLQLERDFGVGALLVVLVPWLLLLALLTRRTSRAIRTPSF